MFLFYLEESEYGCFNDMDDKNFFQCIICNHFLLIPTLNKHIYTQKKNKLLSTFPSYPIHHTQDCEISEK